MKCPECESIVDDNANVCHKCGHIFDDDTQDIENLIQDIIDEEDEEKMKLLGESQVIPKEDKKNHKKEETSKGEKEKIALNEIAIAITRYTIGLLMILSMVGALFQWFALSGEATYIVYQNDANPIIFTGRSMFEFALEAGRTFSTLMAADGTQKRSLVGLINIYYMYGIGVYLMFSLIGLFIVLIFRRLNGVGVMRNLAMFNLLIIGLNVMALKVPYFSVFVLKARDILRFENPKMSVKLSFQGLAINTETYPYQVELLNGLYMTVGFIVAWLFLSAILTELKNKEELDLIDQEEL